MYCTNFFFMLLFYFMSPADFYVGSTVYCSIFLVLFFGIISCNSYAHMEDDTREYSRRICSFLVLMYVFLSSSGACL
jgi:positive regulator of sigma E activity